MAISAKLKSLLKEWDQVKSEISPLKEKLAPLEMKEREIRKQLSECFQDRVEGSKNVIPLANGYALKLNYKVDYKVDPAVLSSITEALTEAKVPVDMVFRNKPEVVKGVYSKLTDEQKGLVDQAITRVPQSPEITLVAPKAAK